MPRLEGRRSIQLSYGRITCTDVKPFIATESTISWPLPSAEMADAQNVQGHPAPTDSQLMRLNLRKQSKIDPLDSWSTLDFTFLQERIPNFTHFNVRRIPPRFANISQPLVDRERGALLERLVDVPQTNGERSLSGGHSWIFAPYGHSGITQGTT